MPAEVRFATAPQGEPAPNGEMITLTHEEFLELEQAITTLEERLARQDGSIQELASILLVKKLVRLLAKRAGRRVKKWLAATPLIVLTGGLLTKFALDAIWDIEQGFREKEVVAILLADVALYEQKGYFCPGNPAANKRKATEIRKLLRQFKTVDPDQVKKMKLQPTHNDYLQHADVVRKMQQLLGVTVSF